MAHFNYYRTGSGADRCYKLVNPKNSKIWDSVGEAMLTHAELDAKSDNSDGFTDITFDDQLHGYPITFSSKLPNGEYDLLIFNATAAEMEADMTKAVEQGLGLKWNMGGMASPPREIFTDLVK